MGQQRHVILRQTVELSIARAADAWPLQQETSRILSKALPLIERCCDELSQPDRLHRIERLELDLGGLDSNRLEEELLAKFGEALRRGLAEQINRQETTGHDPRLAAQLELFAQFARSGSLPWWADLSNPGQPASSLDGLLRDAPDLLRRLLPELAKNPHALRRLAGHFDDRRLAALVFLAAPALGGFPLALCGALLSLPSHLPVLAAMPPARFRSPVWQSILGNAALPTKPPADRLDFSRDLFMRLAHVQAIPYPVLAQGFAQAAAAGRFQGAVCAIAAALGAECVSKSGPAGSEPHAEAEREASAVRLGEGEAGGAAGTELRLWLEGGAREPAPPWLRSWPSALREALMARFQGMGGQPASARPAAALARQQWEQAQARASFSDADEIHLGNAGLVILWPFLGAFFGRLGLLAESHFVDEPARQRGVALLQYLASEDTAPAEYRLPLNKLLCGMELEAVFELETPLAEEETAECDRLLEAAIAQAPVLNQMSIPGFRGSFLLRAGILSVRDGAWLLRVERETYDLVLDRFPWGFQWVKLPWMEAPLQVEW
ncbi:hypothetical protein GPROT1_02737 [Gammaproteobacteria bacterium]|nr:hypothetical protein GPROT1_02737 [Gammaproteobacteria bacterium]